MAAKPLLPAQRRVALYDLVRTKRFATVREMASSTSVSEMTVRRDLEDLEQNGLVHRVRGGARLRDASADAVLPERRFAERLTLQSAAKTAIARSAVRRVRPGDTVALDGSTSVVYLARELGALDVTVLTTNLLVVEALAGTRAEVFLAGGRVRDTTRTVVGTSTVHTLSELHADVVFFSCTGLHETLGITEFDSDEVAVKQALLRLSPRRVGLIDASKYGRRSLLSVGSLDAMTTLISNEAPAGALAEALAAAGVEIEDASAGDR